ncbi:putative Ccc1 family protein [Helianthus annuus]|uniref:Ccc1 family protein n=1 Tax=Helianthus annuus TaxID=4232 RepID=A0A251VQW7_HELAN|nr:membrane protein of ER body-like protein [Helianthus annuus]KAF5822138.1 putative Ccc1 family protein [Helianthus annuus]KAJ0622812.1 putative Ccc1 family protein [Helianthus annuus]KAJ0627013.1 putative Ccc1 family protein [Helianthus annuus]
MEVALNHDTKSSIGSESDTDVEDSVEAGLFPRKPRPQFSSVKADNGDAEEPSDNSTYLHKYGGAIEDLHIQKVVNSVQYDGNNNGETEIERQTAINGGGDVAKAKEKPEQIEEEIMEEEVVELEFEKAIPKLHTHTMHCPNCDNQITKVVLRRKIFRRQLDSHPEPEQPDETRDVLGCFSCLSLFTLADNGGFNPFAIFGNNNTNSSADGNGVDREEGNCLNIFRVFRREKDSEKPNPKIYQDSKHPKPIDQESQKTKHKKPDHQSQIQQGEKSQPDAKGRQPLLSGGLPPHYDDQDQLHGQGDSRLDILPDISTETQDPPRRSARQDSTSFEILKSIVYGGLMEVIASLSIVASAAAGDATTLNIVALALANLIGGVFVIGHNLWDLKDDCYKFSTQQTSNDQEAVTKYKELLGSVEHFPLHAFFAILSFLVFGIIPPVAYGYAFHETNDRDFTMVVVAVASFVCVGLLAIFKAYIDRCTEFSGYVKTITYYLTTAVAVSGVSYAVGDLVERLIEELGLFETSSNISMAVLPEVMSMNPSVAYY